MSNRRFEMYEYRQVIYRMRLGESDRAIAKAGLMGRHKAAELRLLAIEHGWLEKGPLPEDGELATHLGKKPAAAASRSQVLPYADDVEKWFKNGIQGTTIHQALERKYDFSGSYSCVRRYLATLKAANPEVTTILEFEPAEAAQVDFGNSRYFGECLVLREFSDQFVKARYSHSYQWLYADSWYLNKLKDQLQKEFYYDLFDYFPEDEVRLSQLKARDYAKKYGIKPSSPDVWLIAEYPNSWFIEVKKLNEKCKEGQLEGFAIITKYLKCKVTIYRIYSDNEEPKSRWIEHDKKRFQEIYQLLDTL